MPPKKVTPGIAVKDYALKGKSVIITGDIEGKTRASANQMLANAGAIIEKSLNKKVQLVVLGENPGQNKLDKIKELGIETKEWDELVEEIQTDGDPIAARARGNEDEDEEIGEDDDEDEDEEEEKPKAKAKGKAAAKATKTKAKAAPKAKAASSKAASGSSVDGKTVIITGTVPGQDRKSAQAIVEKAGAKVAKSLNKQVELAILGTNAGPDKLKTIEEAGIETIQWSDLAEELGLEVPPEKEVADVQAGEAPDDVDGKTLLITGTIEGHTRASAEKLLKRAGAKFAKSVTQSVELVVLGTKPGDDKLNQIAAMKIPTTTFEALVEKLGLDAEANEPPKKKTRKA